MANYICPECHASLEKRGSHFVCVECDFKQSISIVQSDQNKIHSHGALLPADLDHGYYGLLDSVHDFDLDTTYFRASSAKRDLEKKIDFVQTGLVPEYKQLFNTVHEFDRETTTLRNRVALELARVANVILKEYYGPLKVRDSQIELLHNIADLSKYKNPLEFEKMDISCLDEITPISIGETVGDALGMTLMQTAYDGRLNMALDLASNISLDGEDRQSKEDLKDLGADMLGDLMVNAASAAFHAIGENREAIQQVRDVDEEIDMKIAEMCDNTSGISIEIEQLNKKNKLYSKELHTLEYCVEHGLMPKFSDFLNSQEYLSYREARKEIDHWLNRTHIENEILSVPVVLSRWTALLPKNMKFRYIWKKKTAALDEHKRRNYYSCLRTIGQKMPKSLKHYNTLNIKTEEAYRTFEKQHRPVLETLESYQSLKESMKNFTKVLKIIKKKID